MTVCSVCGRTLDSTETEYTDHGKVMPGDADAIICADCILKYHPYVNER